MEGICASCVQVGAGQTDQGQEAGVRRAQEFQALAPGVQGRCLITYMYIFPLKAELEKPELLCLARVRLVVLAGYSSVQ